MNRVISHPIKVTRNTGIWRKKKYPLCYMSSVTDDNQLSDNACQLSFDAVNSSFNVVVPGKVSGTRSVPSHIEKPPYTSGSKLKDIFRNSGILSKTSDIEVKSVKQIAGMRDACKIARSVLNEAGMAVQCGITTDEIDRIVHNACIAAGAYPSPLLYRGFPKSVCTSVNNVACHGIPDERPLSIGDIINIDVTVYYKGFHGDVSETFLVGDVDKCGKNLVRIAEMCRNCGIDACGPGQPFSIIGKTIQETAEENEYQVVPMFCGHGIGSFFHGPPDIIHIENDVEDIMQEGMTFTVEPVITDGDTDINILEDGWTAVTTDNSRSAQFEHTVLITRHGVEILTL